MKIPEWFDMSDPEVWKPRIWRYRVTALVGIVLVVIGVWTRNEKLWVPGGVFAFFAGLRYVRDLARKRHQEVQRHADRIEDVSDQDRV